MIDNNDLFWAAVRVFLALSLVLIMAFLVIKYGLSRRYAMTVGGKRQMKLLEQLPLGPKTVLSLVALGDKYYLLAHQDNAIQLIKELDQLPAQEKTVAGDVVELIPRSVLEIDQNEENGLNQEQGFRWDTGPFAGSVQKGSSLLAAGMAFLDKIRLQYGNKDSSKHDR